MIKWRKCGVLLLPLLPLLFISSHLSARPRYSVWEGVGCASCHVNPTGAGKRNDTGGQFFMQDLSLSKTRNLVPKELSGRLSSYIAVGSDIRVHNTSTFETTNTNSTTLPQGSLYVELDGGKHLTGYVDQDLANTVNREVFAMVHDNSPVNYYAKAGRFSLPYGLRITDASSPIRTNFNMTFVNQDIGLELGALPGPFEVIAAVSNGVPGGVADENTAKAITTQANWIGKYGRIGASFHWNRRSAVTLLQGGLQGGFRVWRFIWLGEIDLQESQVTTTGTKTTLIAGYEELNWVLIDGLYLKAIYDFLEPNRSAPNDLQHRVAFGFDLYPIPHSQFSLLYRYVTGAGAGDDQLLARLHFFF